MYIDISIDLMNSNNEMILMNPQVPVGLKAVKGEKDTGEESGFAWNERDGEEGHR